MTLTATQKARAARFEPVKVWQSLFIGVGAGRQVRPARPLILILFILQWLLLGSGVVASGPWGGSEDGWRKGRLGSS